MDTLTHGFAGVLLARALPRTGDEGLDRAFARRETWLGFCAAAGRLLAAGFPSGRWMRGEAASGVGAAR